MKIDKETKAIQRIKLASALSLQKYVKPLICTYSGGNKHRKEGRRS